MRSAALVPLAVALLALLAPAGCGGDSGDDERSLAIAAAGDAYDQARASGADLERGPCIAEQLEGLEDWVADIAHDPRRPVDDQPANQCSRFRSGEASHFVELDRSGELIRAQ